MLERNNSDDLSLQSTSLPTWPVPVPKKLPHERSANCIVYNSNRLAPSTLYFRKRQQEKENERRKEGREKIKR